MDSWVTLDLWVDPYPNILGIQNMMNNMSI